MTKSKIEVDRIITNFLRSNLTDINSSRNSNRTNFIFPDFPRTRDLGANDYPTIGITILNESSDTLGMYDDNQYETLTVQIDVVAKKGQKFSVTTTDEAVGTMSSTANSNRLVYAYVPNTITNIKHATTPYTNVVNRSTVSSFTTLTSGTVEWATSTGDLNFASADVSSDDGEAITSTSVLTLEGKKLCQYYAREIIKAIRVNWRTDTTLNGLHDPIKINNTPIPFNEEQGLFRQMVEYEFKSYNIGEGL